MKRLHAALQGCCCACLLAACSPSAGSPGAAATAESLMPLRVAMTFQEGDDAMARHADEEGAVGFLPDFAEEMAKDLGRPLKILSYSPAELYTSLERGEADLALTPGVPPHGLEQHLVLTEPWAASGNAMLVPLNSRITSYSQLRPGGGGQARLLVVAGSRSAAEVGRQFQELPLENVTDVDAGVRELIQANNRGSAVLEHGGRWPCLMVNQREAMHVQREYPRDVRAILRPPPGTSVLWSAAVSREVPDAELTRINRFIRQFQRRGGFDYLADKHLAWERAELGKQEQPFYTDRELIQRVMKSQAQ